MADVFVDRWFDPPLGANELDAMAGAQDARVAADGIEWRESLLDKAGRRMLCRFAAPGEADVRRAFDARGAAIGHVWRGVVHDAAGSDGRRRLAAAPAGPLAPGVPSEKVWAERRLARPVTIDDLRGIESRCAWCFEAHRVELVRTLVSAGLRRIVHLYRAPDAESVRLAHRQAGLEYEVVYAYRNVVGWWPPSRSRVGRPRPSFAASPLA